MSLRYLLLFLFITFHFFVGCGSKPPTVTPAPGTAASPSGGTAPVPLVTPAAPAPLPAAPADVAKTEPVVKLTIDEFLVPASKDVAGTNAKYLGKVIQLQGTVSFTNRRVANGAVVGVVVRLANSSQNSIACEMSDTEAWKIVARGSQITLKGKLAAHVPRPGAVYGTPQLGNIIECVILEAGPSSRIVTTPDQFVEEYNAIGRDGFFEKYRDKDLLMEGEVAGYEQATNGSYCVILKTSTMTHVGLSIGQKKWEATYPIGQKASFTGVYNSAVSTPKQDTLVIESTDIHVE